MAEFSTCSQTERDSFIISLPLRNLKEGGRAAVRRPAAGSQTSVPHLRHICAVELLCKYGAVVIEIVDFQCPSVFVL